MKKIGTLLALLFCLNGWAQIVTTIAGCVGTGAALSVSMDPNSTSIDAAGNLYIADVQNNVIRKVSTTGIITTFAGGGSAYHGNGGQATDAFLYEPKSVITDASGNLYFVGGNAVYKVDASGIITTIAGNNDSLGYSGDGGQATAAKLYNPNSIAIDPSGNIYISDHGNFRIRKINTSGIITTIAGFGTIGFSGDGGQATAAKLNNVSGMTTDAAGNLFIADQNNFRIRMINTSGVITTIAGGITGFSGDGGQATAAGIGSPIGINIDAAGNLYVSDGNFRIRKINSAGIITTIAGNGYSAGPGLGGGFSGDGGQATDAELNNVQNVSFDGSGNIFLADEGNFRIREINSLGVISTFAGNGSAGFSGDGAQASSAEINSPYGVATDANGNIFFADLNNNRIRKINNAGVITTIAGGGIDSPGDGGQATDALISQPQGIAVDLGGNVYFTGSNVVRKVNPAGIISTVAGGGNGGDGGQATDARLNFATAVATDALGNLYIADYAIYRIKKVNPSGIISTIAGGGVNYPGDGGQATSAQLFDPNGLAVDAAGNVYIADYGNNRICKVNTSGIINTIGGNGTLGYTGDGGAATNAQIGAISIALDAMGNIYFSDGKSTVRKINTSGIVTTVAGVGNAGGFSGDGGPATAALFGPPEGVSIDAAGNLYIADYSNNRIRKVSAPLIISVNTPTICTGSTATLTATGATSYSWSPSTGLSSTTGASVVANPSVTTNYTVIGTASGSVGTATTLVTVLASPTITVTSSTLCVGSTCTLTASGASAYAWTPPATISPSTGATVVASPTTTTVYTVVGTAGTCTSSATSTVTVNPLPTVSISPVAAGCIPLCTTFTAATTPIVASYAWDFGNGQYSTAASPYACYTVAATSVVTLSVTATNGCVNTATTSVSVNPVPTIMVTNPAPFCPGDAVPAPTISTVPSSGVIYSWSVSNVNIGMAASGTGIPAPYTAPVNSSLVDQVGIVTYTASLGSCTSTTNETVTIKPTPSMQPVADLFYCPGQLVPQINFACLPASGAPIFMWSDVSGTGISQIGNIPSFTATNTSSVSVVSTIMVSASLNGCPSAPVNFDITVFPNPIANFTSNIACEGQATSFTDLSTPNTGSITVNQWAWDMNYDGITDATVQNPQYTIVPGGSNMVELTVSTNSIPSCLATITQTVSVNPLPVVSYTLMQNAAPYTWDAYPTYPANISTASWDWGDGTNTTGLYPSHTYSATGRYNICVTVTDANGCSGSTCQNDTIYRVAQNNSTNSNMLYVNVSQNVTTGVPQISGLNTQIAIYPNPSNGNFMIETNSPAKQTVQIYDVNGRMVLTQSIADKTVIDASNLSGGMYNISVISNEGVVNKRIVINK